MRTRQWGINRTGWKLQPETTGLFFFAGWLEPSLFSFTLRLHGNGSSGTKAARMAERARMAR